MDFFNTKNETSNTVNNIGIAETKNTIKHLKILLLLALVLGSFTTFFIITYLTTSSLDFMYVYGYVKSEWINTFSMFYKNTEYIIYEDIKINIKEATEHWGRLFFLNMMWGIFIFASNTYAWYDFLRFNRNKFFQKRSAPVTKDKYIRGSVLKTQNQFAETQKINKVQGITIGTKCLFDYRFVPYHLMLYGKTGAGKTVKMTQFKNGIKKTQPNARMMEFDVKRSEIVKYHNPYTDYIIDPNDERSIGISIFNAIHTLSQIDSMTSIIIPKLPNDSDPIWTDTAQSILSGIIHYSFIKGKKTNFDIKKLIELTPSSLAEKFVKKWVYYKMLDDEKIEIRNVKEYIESVLQNQFVITHTYHKVDGELIENKDSLSEEEQEKMIEKIQYSKDGKKISNHEVEKFKKKIREDLIKEPICYKGTSVAYGNLTSSESQSANFMSNFRSKAKFFTSMPDDLDESFNIEEWIEGKGQSTIWILNDTENKELNAIRISVFVTIMIKKQLSLSDSTKRRVFYFIDELGSLNPIPSLEDSAALGRSKGLVLVLAIQDEQKFEEKWGEGLVATIVGSCTSKIIMKAGTVKTAEPFSKTIGDVTYETMTKSYSSSVESEKGGERINYTRTIKTEPAVSKEEILAMENHTCWFNNGGDWCFIPVGYTDEQNQDYKRFDIREEKICEAFVPRASLDISILQKENEEEDIEEATEDKPNNSIESSILEETSTVERITTVEEDIEEPEESSKNDTGFQDY